jgi:L,D-peptidoglycan transpeptidase YkuD (ErfK/YbiS/YcfS/YnhG family)
MLVVRPVCYWRKNRTQRVCWGVVQMAGHPAVTREGIGSSPIAPATLCTLFFNREKIRQSPTALPEQQTEPQR